METFNYGDEDMDEGPDEEDDGCNIYMVYVCKILFYIVFFLLLMLIHI